ncbi:MAG: diguanylate cyclase [bacterium]|nr:diguanylate cyclase [bacterium]
MSLRLKLILFISFLFLVSIANSFFIFQLESYGEEKLEWVVHTNDVLIHSERLESYLIDTETGQRGYLLTLDPSYLEPYYNGLIKSKEEYTIIKKLTSDNNKQQTILKSIKKNMDLKFDELRTTIDLAKHSKNNEALNVVKKNNGKKYMDNIRVLISSFNNAEQILLEKRKGDFRTNRARITLLIVVEIVVFIFLAIMTFVFLIRNLFSPLKLLLSCTKRMEEGEKLEISDIVEKNEIGQLLSSFFKMHEKVYEKTQILTHEAYHDELTGLNNRAKMYDEIQYTLQNAKDKVAVLFIDLKKFKQLNDTFGHDIGDFVLQETARRLKNSVRNRTDDIVYRIGGDEFLVLIKNIKNISELHKIVANILNVFDPEAEINGRLIKILLSIGIAISPDNTSDSNEIVKFADIAMYSSKREQDSHYKIFDRSMLKRAGDAK